MKEALEVEAALRLALEELENCADLLKVFEAPIDSCVGAAMLGAEKAANAIKEALAQQSNEQVKPYCWTWDEWMTGGKWRAEYGWKKPERQVTNLQPLYTHSPVPYVVEPRTAQPKPLTDEKISLIAHNIDTGDWNDLNFKECWHEGFKAGFREAEIEHNIKG